MTLYVHLLTTPFFKVSSFSHFQQGTISSFLHYFHFSITRLSLFFIDDLSLNLSPILSHKLSNTLPPVVTQASITPSPAEVSVGIVGKIQSHTSPKLPTQYLLGSHPFLWSAVCNCCLHCWSLGEYPGLCVLQRRGIEVDYHFTLPKIPDWRYVNLFTDGLGWF